MTEPEPTPLEELDAPPLEESAIDFEGGAQKRAARQIAELIQEGASPLQALDMWAVDRIGYKASIWARATDREPSAVHQSLSRARNAVYSEDGE
jgi:hypothetical protein